MRLFSKINHQFTILMYSVSYFTRLPIPGFIQFDEKQFHKAAAYFPVIGAIAACVMAVSFYLFQLIFNVEISLILVLAAAVLLTGALHEDGFADCCDGFGGGCNTQQRLHIMKDSQIGSYAGVGLILLTLLKIAALLKLTELDWPVLYTGLFASQIMSRGCTLLIMQSSLYVRLQKDGKAKGLAKKLPLHYLFLAGAVSLSPLLLFTLLQAVLVVFTLLIITLLLRFYFDNKLGGYTGDCLGLTQQVTEVTIYLLIGSWLF
ncbi:adenosylcobinamide-GDP ribazoletransferase [Psychromonas ossibalaenae]|uniref:adenosylcobinamide-GDP ribazoletransferase n=1 Tax=Psychromonas ossibalaenae TaxID=444922 RepID=UPI00037FFA93|nr:adenosylcobinamide-GDP ribazoletransferase [Psychromonas ossibalaenae]